MKPIWEPTAAEISRFLLQYNLGTEDMVEDIKITKDGIYEFTMFLIWRRKQDEHCLVVMWPSGEQNDYT